MPTALAAIDTHSSTPNSAVPAGSGFGRMFPELPACDVDDDAITALFRWLRDGDHQLIDDSGIPAGFTYFAQFVDHDITFDPSPVSARIDGLMNQRAPRLDLESLYGSGPIAQPFLYDWSPSGPTSGTKLLLSRARLAESDLPRNEAGRALVADPRNDENLIVAQLHMLFARFHNAVVDELHHRSGHEGRTLFAEAQRIVRWHYQWIVSHEFLRRVTGASSWPVERHLRWDGTPFIPVEFSGAAYRFGHAMVRPDYGLNGDIGRAVAIFPTVEQRDHLQGFRVLPSEFVIEWDRFFELGPPGDPLRPQQALRLDTAIVPALFHLPGPTVPYAVTDDELALPLLDLRRGRMLGLPSGQDVAHALQVPVLKDDELQLEAIDNRASREALRRSTPLWYYVLCEAATHRFGGGGRHLGPVGGRIVAEVLVALLEGDEDSYLNCDSTWRPDLPAVDDGDFTMADLIRFTLSEARRSRLGRVH